MSADLNSSCPSCGRQVVGSPFRCPSCRRADRAERSQPPSGTIVEDYRSLNDIATLVAPAAHLSGQTVPDGPPPFDSSPGALPTASEGWIPSTQRDHSNSRASRRNSNWASLEPSGDLVHEHGVDSPHRDTNQGLADTVYRNPKTDVDPLSEGFLKWLAIVLLGAGVILMLSASGIAVLLPEPALLSGKIVTNELGEEQVVIACASCSDGSVLRANNAEGVFQSGRTALAPEGGVALGQDQFFAQLQPPGRRARRASVALTPINHRIRYAADSLEGKSPQLWLKIETIPGTVVQIDGLPVPLDQHGQARHPVALGARLKSESARVAPLNLTSTFRLDLPSGMVETGTVELHQNITPLVVDSPGPLLIVSEALFTLAGKTLPRASIWVADSPISIDANGTFSQPMSIDSIGETLVTVRAEYPGMASRATQFRIRRVPNLQTEALQLASAALPYTWNMPLIPDDDYTFTGHLTETSQEFQTQLLGVALDGHCPSHSCVVRFRYDSRLPGRVGAHVRVFGRGSVLPSSEPETTTLEPSLVVMLSD